MKQIKKYNDFLKESVNKNIMNDFINDFGFFITLNLSQITKNGIDENSTKELSLMMSNLRKPIINGKTFTELITDVNNLYNNPKLLSAFLGKIREFLIYIEPRINKFVKDCDYKNKWLEKISNLKDRYKQIVS